ncbi:hypothetical protein D5S18_15995 [Nocardia panacis]|uniref:Uncharacterized protein n=1 Tax=Nocardia panacis TaxID=2340916 RepID=A0A3A4K7C7_9NOCA|nr:hypothetical protein D5S18_15995 [Nocardia panacis]
MISTALRLGRIASLVAGSLVFLYGCEVSRSPLLTDVWVEVVVAMTCGAVALICAWFEIARRDRRPPPDECRFESAGFAVRVRIVASGELVFRGRELVDGKPEYEWAWTFRPDTFADIRATLEGRGHLLELLNRTVPHLDRELRDDPGGWLHDQGIPATFRERGVSPSRVTADLRLPNRPRSRAPIRYESDAARRPIRRR